MPGTIPNAEEAYIDRSKLRGYLLSETHPIGSSKAAFFGNLGYLLENAEALEAHLLGIVAGGENWEMVESPHGAKYIVDGSVQSPTGVSAVLRTVWMLDLEGKPRLVTAYPA